MAKINAVGLALISAHAIVATNDQSVNLIVSNACIFNVCVFIFSDSSQCFIWV